jgi:hypothetical protein
MRVAYVTTYDANDIRNWSGTGYYIAQALQQQSISVEFIGSLKRDSRILFKCKEYIYRKFLKKEYLVNRELAVLRSYAKQVSRKIKNIDVDIVFSPSTIPISYLECEKPIVFWTDSTFAGMIDFYMHNLCKESIINGNLMEQSALQRCKFAIYSSDWAAKTAIDN